MENTENTTTNITTTAPEVRMFVTQKIGHEKFLSLPKEVQEQAKKCNSMETLAGLLNGKLGLLGIYKSNKTSKWYLGTAPEVTVSSSDWF